MKRIFFSQSFKKHTAESTARIDLKFKFHGMGALVCEHDYSPSDIEDGIIDWDQLAHRGGEVLIGSSQQTIQELLSLNGSSAGARPKALIGIDRTRLNITHGAKQLADGFEPWLPESYQH